MAFLDSLRIYLYTELYMTHTMRTANKVLISMLHSDRLPFHTIYHPQCNQPSTYLSYMLRKPWRKRRSANENRPNALGIDLDKAQKPDAVVSFLPLKEQVQRQSSSLSRTLTRLYKRLGKLIAFRHASFIRTHWLCNACTTSSVAVGTKTRTPS